MIKLIKQQWKEGKELQLSNKDVVMSIIKGFTIYPIQNRWQKFIINRYGRESYFLKRILSKKIDRYHNSNLIHLYYDSKRKTKKALLDKLLIAVKLLNDYKELQLYLDRSNVKTKALTEQYREVSSNTFSKASIFWGFGECEDIDCKQCNEFIKEESDKIRKQLKLK